MFCIFAFPVPEVPPCKLDKSYLAVVAIDFGTTYSGFAFSFNAGQEKDEIFLNRDWTNEQNCRTSKTPTCLLLRSDMSFDSFGYDAVEKYADLQSKKEGEEYFFFQHFKMELHSNEVKQYNSNLLKSKLNLGYANNKTTQNSPYYPGVRTKRAFEMTVTDT